MKRVSPVNTAKTIAAAIMRAAECAEQQQGADEAAERLESVLSRYVGVMQARAIASVCVEWRALCPACHVERPESEMGLRHCLRCIRAERARKEIELADAAE